MIRNQLVIAVVVVALLGVSAGGAYAAGRVTGERAGAEKGRQETITELQGQFQQTLARLQQESATQGQGARLSGSNAQGVTPTPTAGQSGETGQNVAPGFGGFGGAGGARGGGTAGRIEKVEGSSLTVSTAQGGTVTIVLSDATAISKTAAGSRADLRPGVQVVVAGQRQADGTVQATQVTIAPGAG
ncbi:MAG: hypothetical protein HY688_02430 [Chloroflexi bacterium]|nr:hypothetical protein [Chloroflexota bacterium]